MRLGPDDAGDGGSVGNKQKGTRRPYRHRLHRSTSTARPIMSPRTEAEGQRVAVARDKRSKHLRDIARQLVAGGVAGAGRPLHNCAM